MKQSKQSLLKALGRRLKTIKISRKMHKQGTFVQLIQSIKDTTFLHIRKSISKYVRNERPYKSLYNDNMTIVIALGYKPRVTKKPKVKVEHVFDGYTCKERRLILRTQRKLSIAA